MMSLEYLRTALMINGGTIASIVGDPRRFNRLIEYFRSKKKSDIPLKPITTSSVIQITALNELLRYIPSSYFKINTEKG